MKILVAVGTRPEAIKLAPVILALRQKGLGVEVLFSRQHEALARDVFDIFQIIPDHVFEKPAASFALHDIAASFVQQAGNVIAASKPDMVLVQGDTTTAFACALAAYYHRCPVGHVEAGLRTGDPYSPYPEENHRRMIAVLSELHFAPSVAAANALRAEGMGENVVSITGNTVIDALRWVLEHVPNTHDLTGGDKRPYLLVTAHRRENFGAMHQSYFRQIEALAQAMPELQVLFVSHPNPNVQELVRQELHADNIRLLSPQRYDVFAHLMQDARLIITDSGGVQEESAYLGKPTLVMRENTERKELQQGGNLIVVGAGEGQLLAEARKLLTDAAYYAKFARVQLPYGTGEAAQHIIERIMAWQQQRSKTS